MKKLKFCRLNINALHCCLRNLYFILFFSYTICQCGSHVRLNSNLHTSITTSVNVTTNVNVFKMLRSCVEECCETDYLLCLDFTKINDLFSQFLSLRQLLLSTFTVSVFRCNCKTTVTTYLK